MPELAVMCRVRSDKTRIAVYHDYENGYTGQDDGQDDDLEYDKVPTMAVFVTLK